jgi:hypothetical protein
MAGTSVLFGDLPDSAFSTVPQSCQLRREYLDNPRTSSSTVLGRKEATQPSHPQNNTMLYHYASCYNTLRLKSDGTK